MKYLVENDNTSFWVGYKFCNDGIHAISEGKFCDGSNKDGCRDE